MSAQICYNKAINYNYLDFGGVNLTKFYFIRHGEDISKDINTKIYKNWGMNMITLTETGISQIRKLKDDERLKNAQIIVSSPYGRALHSAAILSKELGIDLVVETNLHEWVADKDYNYLSMEDARKSFREFENNKGIKNKECKYNWEDLETIKNRIISVLNKYKDYDDVIIVTHGAVIKYFLNVDHPENGQIIEYIYD